MLAFVRRRPLLAVIGCALALRVAAAVAVQYQLDHVWQRPFVIEGDAAGYWELGSRLAAGEPYAVHEPPRRVLRMPGFPAVLAVGITLSNGSFPATRLLLACVGTAACVLVYVLGKTLFDARTGLVAAGLAAVSPVMIGFSVMILSETLFALALVASLIALARLVQTGFAGVAGAERSGAPAANPGLTESSTAAAHRRGAAWAVASGLAIALAGYVRPTWLVAGPLFAVAYVIASRGARVQALVRGVVLVACVYAALVPWAARNHAVTGHWVWTTLWVGPSLYDGLHPGATGESDMEFFDRERLSAEMSEYEVDRHYRQRAWTFVREHPGRTLELALKKLWRYSKPWPSAEQFGGIGPQAAVAVFFVPAVVLAAIGGWRHRSAFWRWALTAGPIVLMAAVHMVFVGSLRYRLPAEYPLYVLTAAGLLSLLRRRRDEAGLTESTSPGRRPLPLDAS